MQIIKLASPLEIPKFFRMGLRMFFLLFYNFVVCILKRDVNQ